jgi:hypothetical protein
MPITQMAQREALPPYPSGDSVTEEGGVNRTTLERVPAKVLEHLSRRGYASISSSQSSQRNISIMEPTMNDAQAFSFKDYSLTSVDLIDHDIDDDDLPSEADARELHYRQFARALDREDLKRIILAQTQQACHQGQ